MIAPSNILKHYNFCAKALTISLGDKKSDDAVDNVCRWMD